MLSSCPIETAADGIDVIANAVNVAAVGGLASPFSGIVAVAHFAYQNSDWMGSYLTYPDPSHHPACGDSPGIHENHDIAYMDYVVQYCSMHSSDLG